jgi:hypothetical protein
MKPSIVSSSSFAKGLNSAMHANLSACYAFSVYDAGNGNAHTRQEGGIAPAPKVIDMFVIWTS